MAAAVLHHHHHRAFPHTNFVHPRVFRSRRSSNNSSSEARTSVSSLASSDSYGNHIGHRFSQHSQRDSERTAKEMRAKDLYRTALCENFKNHGRCEYNDKCRFAHSETELRPTPLHPKYKTVHCRNYIREGRCYYGKACQFLHDGEDDVYLNAVRQANVPVRNSAKNGIVYYTPMKSTLQLPRGYDVPPVFFGNTARCAATYPHYFTAPSIAEIFDSSFDVEDNNPYLRTYGENVTECSVDVNDVTMQLLCRYTQYNGYQVLGYEQTASSPLISLRV